MSESKTTNPRQLSGTVVSSKMKDTIVVAVERLVKHPKYHKFIAKTKRYQAHDAENTAAEGDKVVIQEVKPISKNKRFTLVK